MTQTALTGTADDATIAQLMDFTETNPADQILVYTDVAIAPTANGVAASTLLQYSRVKTNNATKVFNATTLLPATVVATLPVNSILFINKRANHANNTQLLYLVAAGTYAGDWVKHEDVDFMLR